MPKKRHKAEEIVAKLRQVEVLTAQGKPVAKAIRDDGLPGRGLAASNRRLCLTPSTALPAVSPKWCFLRQHHRALQRPLGHSGIADGRRKQWGRPMPSVSLALLNLGYYQRGGREEGDNTDYARNGR